MTSQAFDPARKWFGVPPRFDPEQGETVFLAPGEGYGYWAGAPSAVYDPEEGCFYLAYRRRWPLHEGRGAECCIARSEDGAHFENIWSARKEDFGANSIERASLIQDPSGEWRLYIGFEVARAYDRNPPTWRVSLLQADAPDSFDPGLERPIMDGSMYGFTFVKDPVVVIVGGEYYAFCSVGLPRQHEEDASGERRALGRGWSAMMRSPDGVRFPTARVVLSPGDGWDRFQARITSLLYVPPAWFVFYDGAPGRADGYDEFTGLAVTWDFEVFRRLSVDGPWVLSPHASRSIRYLEALQVGDEVHFYYEYARPDRSHELRHNVVRL